MFLVGILGLVLRSSVAIFIINKVKTLKGSSLGLFIGGFLIGGILNLFVYDYNPARFSPIIQIVLMLLIPPITSLLGFYNKDLISLVKKQF